MHIDALLNEGLQLDPIICFRTVDHLERTNHVIKQCFQSGFDLNRHRSCFRHQPGDQILPYHAAFREEAPGNDISHQRHLGKGCFQLLRLAFTQPVLLTS